MVSDVVLWAYVGWFRDGGLLLVSTKDLVIGLVLISLGCLVLWLERSSLGTRQTRDSGYDEIMNFQRARER